MLRPGCAPLAGQANFQRVGLRAVPAFYPPGENLLQEQFLVFVSSPEPAALYQFAQRTFSTKAHETTFRAIYRKKLSEVGQERIELLLALAPLVRIHTGDFAHRE